MVAREYPVPHVTPDGAVLCPPGFVATRPKKKEEGRKEEEQEKKDAGITGPALITKATSWGGETWKIE